MSEILRANQRMLVQGQLVPLGVADEDLHCFLRQASNMPRSATQGIQGIALFDRIRPCGGVAWQKIVAQRFQAELAWLDASG